MIASNLVYQTDHRHHPLTVPCMNDRGLSMRLRHSRVEEGVR